MDAFMYFVVEIIAPVMGISLAWALFVKLVKGND